MAGPTKVRLKLVRRADNTNDDQGSPAIDGAISSSVTAEDYEVFYLSRLRQVIFGESSPGDHWYSDFLGDGILSLQDLTTAVGASSTLDSALTYDSNGLLIQVTLSDSRVKTLSYNSLGQLEQVLADVVGGGTLQTDLAYNADGTLATVTKAIL